MRYVLASTHSGGPVSSFRFGCACNELSTSNSESTVASARPVATSLTASASCANGEKVALGKMSLLLNSCELPWSTAILVPDAPSWSWLVQPEPGFRSTTMDSYKTGKLT